MKLRREELADFHFTGIEDFVISLPHVFMEYSVVEVEE
jgi:hypothetical protein